MPMPKRKRGPDKPIKGPHAKDYWAASNACAKGQGKRGEIKAAAEGASRTGDKSCQM